MPGILSFLLLLLALSTAAVAGTFTAATCNVADVNSVINGPTHTAVDGDVIVIPAGSCTWASGVVVPTGIGITLTGVGSPTADPTVTGADASCSQTVITQTVAAGSLVAAFTEAPAYGNATSRISCMAINYGSGPAAAMKVLGTCTASGCPSLRWDNLTFNNWNGHTGGISYAITAIGDMFGVVDHNSILGAPANGGTYLHLMELSHASYLGVGFNGDNSWAQPGAFGSANFLFLENNHFLNAGSMDNEGSAGTLANQGGGRPVARYNVFDGPNGVQFPFGWHGTETGTRPRSSRAWEFYGNTWNCDGAGIFCQGMATVRGGTGYTWGNSYIQLASGRINNTWYLVTNRSKGFIVWGVCDGSAVYDTNDGTTYFSGTIASVTGGPQNPTVTVSGTDPGWTTNQWVPVGAPYSLHDVTQNTGTELISNGSNTLVPDIGSGSPGGWTPAVSDSITITRATVCLDQAGGRGAGFLYTGTTAGPNFAGTPLVAANQAVEPSYFWLNSLNLGSLQHNIVSSTKRVVGGRDYYAELINQSAQTSPTSPFNGTSTLGMDGGIGHGTLANRPTTCTINTAYWATDQGSWNQVSGGSQGQLYFCTAPNTWTLSYTPYTYPHPLVTGGSVTPPPTAALGGVTSGGIFSGGIH